MMDFANYIQIIKSSEMEAKVKEAFTKSVGYDKEMFNSLIIYQDGNIFLTDMSKDDFKTDIECIIVKAFYGWSPVYYKDEKYIDRFVRDDKDLKEDFFKKLDSLEVKSAKDYVDNYFPEKYDDFKEKEIKYRIENLDTSIVTGTIILFLEDLLDKEYQKSSKNIS